MGSKPIVRCWRLAAKYSSQQGLTPRVVPMEDRLFAPNAAEFIEQLAENESGRRRCGCNEVMSPCLRAIGDSLDEVVRFLLLLRAGM